MGVRATHGVVRQSASAKLNGARDRRLVPRGQLNGYRLIVLREADRVRLITRNGHDWSGRVPWITEAALKNRNRHFAIDGEAVSLRVDGVADFNARTPG